MARRNESQSPTFSGAELSNPQIHTSSFLIAVYFKTAPGQTDVVLIQKINGAGYVLGVNQTGGVTFATTASGATAWLDSRSAVNDGQWHQVIAEAIARRKGSRFTLMASRTPLVPALGPMPLWPTMPISTWAARRTATP